MSFILRYCSTSTGSIEENLIGFLAITETAGEYLTNAILGELEKNGLDIQNCRGQGCKYDTRLENRIEAVKAALLQFDDVVECIENLKNQTEQSDSLNDYDSVLN
ncbi:DUF4371 domain-containing protein [Trichonephila clavipes]|nr:DUF4371 domain-containing protein [Trichonephila clavipes]